MIGERRARIFLAKFGDFQDFKIRRFRESRVNIFFLVGLLDFFQILVLSLAPSPAVENGLGAIIPQPSLGFFLHVFLGNTFIGTQEMIPIYSLYVFGRSLYLLVPSMTLLSNTWHMTRTEATLRVFTFAYSWVEVSAYSYAVIQSFTLLHRMIKRRPVSSRRLLRGWAIVVGVLAVAATLEVMAMGVIA